MLLNLVDLGHRLAQLVVAQAESGAIPAAKASTAFDGVTRSIRRCAWLAHHLTDQAKTIDRVVARKQIIRTVEDTIQRHAEEPEADTLREELMDRLDTPDLEDEIGNRPIDEIIIDIVRDLGLAAAAGNHPWQRRTPEDVAILCARAAQPIPPQAEPGATALSPRHGHRARRNAWPAWDPSAEAASPLQTSPNPHHRR